MNMLAAIECNVLTDGTVSQLLTHNHCLIDASEVVTHCAPHVVVADLDAATSGGADACAASKPHSTSSAICKQY